MTLKEAEKLIKFARKNGVTKITFGEFQAELETLSPRKRSSKSMRVVSNEQQEIPVTGDASPSEDEMLYLSSPYYDVLKTQRESQS